MDDHQRRPITLRQHLLRQRRRTPIDRGRCLHVEHTWRRQRARIEVRRREAPWADARTAAAAAAAAAATSAARTTATAGPVVAVDARGRAGEPVLESARG